MNNEQLKKANELQEVIEVTKQALKKAKEYKPEDREPEESLDDKMYSFSFGEYGKISLNRYYGNKSLMNVIVQELERQLAEFENMFAKL